jgi:hypothetical protein
MKIPDVGRLYYLSEYELFIIFRKILCNPKTFKIKYDTYTDSSLKEKADYTPQLDEDIRTGYALTFTEVDTPAERKRRPFDFADMPTAISLLTEKKYRRCVTVQVEKEMTRLFQITPGETQAYHFDTLYYQYLFRQSDGKIMITGSKEGYRYSNAIVIPEQEIVRISFHRYEWRRIK